MEITLRKSSVRALRQSDNNFYINDGLVITPRAGFEVNHHCPREYKMIIQECMSKGWLKPVAHVTDYELLVMTLGKE